MITLNITFCRQGTRRSTCKKQWLNILLGTLPKYRGIHTITSPKYFCNILWALKCCKREAKRLVYPNSLHFTTASTQKKRAVNDGTPQTTGRRLFILLGIDPFFHIS
ncbi:unnamed protein product [Ixodes persulcatus]